VNDSGILIVESDLLVLYPLADYLRECGYYVVEASSAGEARTILNDVRASIDIVLADVGAADDNGFALASWIRQNHQAVEVILTGSIATATQKAAELCHEGPDLAKPYEHYLVLERIKRLRGARDRNP
jgi:DNA-binding response OmpR family regulator